MARKLLALSRFGDSFQALRVEKQGENLVPLEGLQEINSTDLSRLCSWADEIYYGGAFPTTLYLWSELPNVGRKYRSALVGKTVNSKIGGGVKVEFAFYSETLREESDRNRTPIIAIPDHELEPVWLELLPCKDKIKRIIPLPLGLAALAVQLLKPDKSFLVAWVSRETTEIIVSSPEGLVKVARSVPIGMVESDHIDAFASERFIVDLGREISMTQTFFKQEFRQQAPTELLLLAGSTVLRSLEQFPLNVVGLSIKTPENSPFSTLAPEQIGPLAHLLGTFSSVNDFNFLSPEVAAGRRAQRTFIFAYALLGVALLGAVGWYVFLGFEKLNKIAEYEQHLVTYNQTKDRVLDLQRDVKSLRPLRGWEKYYKEVYQNRPQWNMLISELALKVSREIVIDNFLIVPDKNRSKKAWRGSLDGKIRALDWQSGLDKLREFGSELEASPAFMVKSINYVPKQLSAPGARTFTFKMNLEVKTEAELKTL